MTISKISHLTHTKRNNINYLKKITLNTGMTAYNIININTECTHNAQDIFSKNLFSRIQKKNCHCLLY